MKPIKLYCYFLQLNSNVHNEAPTSQAMPNMHKVLVYYKAAFIHDNLQVISYCPAVRTFIPFCYDVNISYEHGCWLHGTCVCWCMFHNSRKQRCSEGSFGGHCGVKRDKRPSRDQHEPMSDCTQSLQDHE